MSFNPLSTSNLSMALLRYTYHKYQLFLRGMVARRFANATFSELKPREISSAAAAKGITAVKGVSGDLFGGSSARLFLRGRLGALRRRRLPLWCDGDPVEQVQVDFIGHKHGMSLH